MSDPNSDSPKKRSKRANGEGTIYHRADGRWSVTFLVMAPSGKRERLVRYGKTQKEALAIRRSIDADLASGRTLAPAKALSVAAYGELWLTGTLKSRVDLGRLAPGSWNFYKDLWSGYIAPTLGGRRIDTLTPPMLRTWLAEVAQAPGPKGKPPSASTLRGVHATLRKALSDAVADGLINTNPAKAIHGPSVPRYAARFLSREEAKRLRKVIAGHQHEALLLVLLGCGLRIGEALALRWSDLDLDGRVIQVTGTVGELAGDMKMEGGSRPRGRRSTKTASSTAAVPVPAFVVDALRRQKAEVARVQLASSVWRDNDLVFPSSIGTAQDRANIAKGWVAIRTKAQLEGLRLHDLRHSTASFLIAAGTPLKVVQEVLRHSRLATTADVYAHLLPEVKMEAADLLDSYLAGDA